MTMPAMPSLPDAERERVRGYLIAQAAKLSLPDLVAKVQSDARPIEAVARSVPAERFRERPGAEDWSAAEVFAHIVDMTEHGADAIESVIDGKAVPRRIEDQLIAAVRSDTRTAEDFWRAYSDRRAQLYARVLDARGDEHLDVTIQHPLFGPLNWREWFLFMRVHDLDHLRQMQTVAEHLRGV